MKNFPSLNKKGSILIETLIAAAIIGAVILISSSGIQQINKLSKSSSVNNSADKQISQIIEGVRTGLENYQIDYHFIPNNTAVYQNPALNVDLLPMAWDTDIQAPVNECPNCPGRFGFVIQPYEKFRGLFLVTLRISHNKWPTPKDFQFVVSAK